MAWIANVNPNELITSAWANTIRDHVVNTFTNAAARNTAIPTPVAGMTCWVSDVAALQVYNGTAWVNVPVGAALVRAEITAPSGAVAGTPLAVPGLAAPITTLASHRYKITAQVTIGQQGAASLARPSLFLDSASRIAGGFVSLAAGGYMTITLGTLAVVAAGAHTFSVYLSTDAGTAIVHADAGGASWIMAEDVGP